jgi:hypothetical protein
LDEYGCLKWMKTQEAIFGEIAFNFKLCNLWRSPGPPSACKRWADLRPRRPADAYSEHGIQQGFGVGTLRQPVQDVLQASVEQQHGKTVDQRPGAGDRRSLIERQRLLVDLLMAAGADRTGKAGERSFSGLMQRGP